MKKKSSWGSKIENGTIFTIFTILGKFVLKSQLFGKNAPGLCFVGSREAIFGHFEQKSAKVLQNAKNAQKVIFGPKKCILGSKERKSAFSAFLRFLTSGAFIWAYYSKVSCVLAEASELL